MARDTPKRRGTVRVGCAGWSLPKDHAARFPAEGAHLARYAGRLPAVEINSSFYKPHNPATCARWAASVPEDFRFSVKVPKEVAHTRRLVDAADVLGRFLPEAAALGAKLGPLLVQLPPSLAFAPGVADAFFTALRERFDGDVALEPRHPSWFGGAADRLAAGFRVARAAADPAVAAAGPGGWGGLVYHRLHGWLRVYYSAYPEEYLADLAVTLSAAAGSAVVWCVFDNTAAGSATANALDLLARVGPG